MTKTEARQGLVKMIKQVSIDQDQELEIDEIEWLIDSADEFNDTDLGSMIGDLAVPTFRKVVALIS